MNRAEAKRLACGMVAGNIRVAISCGTEHEMIESGAGELSDDDYDRVITALEEIADELTRRAHRRD